MGTKIDKKIIGYGIKPGKENQSAPTEPKPEPKAEIIRMHEKLERPDVLLGSTYKIKPPFSEHALYITINDMVLNRGTEHEHRQPFEIFINSKNMEHFQWIVALTRIMSAVFRKGGDVTFLVEEMHSVFDPKGGYLKKGGRYVPSLVAEIGDVVETHLRKIGMLSDPEIDEHRQEYLDDLRMRYEAAKGIVSPADDGEEARFPEGSSLCEKCHTIAVIRMDGCMTCLACGDSKCG
ncbi:TSCPD domain-containing protein [Thioalkalivibrio sp. HK1]|uniref:TSCPD domain-containing protein n=1 Tax=Thioalkalivibrio sp. HK1 TaxID=1469245 RepID=UPI0004704240|nr:NrdJb [Thioalkalivibrio sp. HK1]